MLVLVIYLAPILDRPSFLPLTARIHIWIPLNYKFSNVSKPMQPNTSKRLGKSPGHEVGCNGSKIVLAIWCYRLNSRCFCLTIVSGFGLRLIVCFLFFYTVRLVGFTSKVFETHVFPFVFLRIIFFGRLF